MAVIHPPLPLGAATKTRFRIFCVVSFIESAYCFEKAYREQQTFIVNNPCFDRALDRLGPIAKVMNPSMAI
jgi:hypothetical protein